MKMIDEPDMPLAINFIRLKSYLLSPDEAVLFDMMIIKASSFEYKPFYYSQRRIEDEIRIKRRRQDKIISYFEDLGIIHSEVKENATGGKVRYFSVNFNALSNEKILSEIIDRNSDLFNKVHQYIKYHSAQQKKSLKKKSEETEIYKETVNDLYIMLNQTYKRRCEMFNEKKQKKGETDGFKSIVKMPRNKTLEKRLFALSELYDSGSIENSFIAFVDWLLREADVEEKPSNIMNYFLTHDFDNNEWAVFEKFLNKFSNEYSYSGS